MPTPPTRPPKPFRGRTSEMRDSPWLASEDIRGAGDVVVTIKEVWFHGTVQFEDRKRPNVFALEFVGKKKQLVINSTNRHMLDQLFNNGVKSATTEPWLGKTIALYVDESVMMRGKAGGIRIRPEIPSEPAQGGA